MEFNKDEAARARDIAKTKFLADDLMGARRFALKAQSMYPELEGISQMVATFNVLESAKKITHGEIDYYGVIGVSPEADDETVRKSYKKLAALIHPDRNKTVGAEEAFKFLSQAWVVFSDKAKRAEYDLKRHKGRGASSSSSPKPPNNSAQRVVNTSVNPPAALATPLTDGGGTFWTVCHTCKTQYEYPRTYMKRNLKCHNCNRPFIAVETDAPGSSSILKPFNEHELKKSMSTPTHDPPQTGAPKDEVVRRKYNKRAAGGSLTNAPKRRKVKENGFAANSNTVKDLSEEDVKNLLTKKVKPLISRKLQELCNAVPETVAVDSSDIPMETQAALEALESMLMDSIPDTLVTDEDVMVDVPNPDFCDFDKDRSEESFADNEIWACYDSVDAMPRSYVMVSKVISADPFKVSMVRLTSETSNEVSLTNWLGSGIEKTCGGYREKKTQICKSPYVFSHKVKLVQGNNGEFLIYPRKGDVWAMYRNWSPEWSYVKESVEYDLVEVVEGYTEEFGVSVVPLIKVARFRSVFHHHVDANEVRRIFKDEIARFSHQIPSYLLTGNEAADAPRGCTQLDPAATPSKHLQVIIG
ncbi:unnamed protein product [Microthlaspi erraticum]|uniref:J domain-containing protein n=1 Tax=Microthlaspi erraticum TaxID=1685480 RepID=A0A6D2IZ92_9BRAS|nr:unnamed protein product [Microthlaspi erraticum]